MLIVVTCFVKFLKNTLDFKDVAKMLPKMLYLCSNQNGTNMASIELSISSKEDKVTHRSEILIRFVPFRGANLRVKSGLFISPKHFRYFINRTKTLKTGIAVPEKVLSINKEEAAKKGYELKSYGEVVVADRIITPEVKNSKQQKQLLDELLASIMEAFASAHKDDVDAVWLDKIVNRFHHPTRQPAKKGKRERKKNSIYDLAEEYLEKKRFSYDHTKAFRVLIRDWARYEAFKKKVMQEKFAWNIDKMTRKDIEDFEEYLRYEKTLSEKYPKQFESILEEYPVEINVVHTMTKLQDRGENTIVKLKKKFKAFMQWLYETERTTNRPFDGIKIGVEKYGTPIYITKEERNLVAETDIPAMFEKLDDEDKKACSKLPLRTLETQRDIFVFQCLVGCRVGDLTR